MQIHPDTTFQTIVGFGAGYHAQSLSYLGRLKDPDAAYEALYGDKGVRLNIVRLVIPPSAKPLSGTTYDWASDKDTQDTFSAIKPVLSRIEPICYAVPFSPPPLWKDTGQSPQGGTLKQAHYQDYAGYLADFLVYCRSALGLDIDVLSLQNEPDVVAPWDSCTWTGTQLAEFLKILKPALQARSLTARVMAPEGTSWSGSKQLLDAIRADPAASALLDIVASHSYTPTGAPADPARAGVAAAAAQSGLPIWMSELSLMRPEQPDDPGMTAALRIAAFLYRDLVQAQASAWIYCFGLFRTDFPGTMGLLGPVDTSLPPQPLTLPKRFFALAQYSRFVRPGWKRIAIDDSGSPTSGFINPKGSEFALIAMNASAKPRQVDYEFVGWTPSAMAAHATTIVLNLASVTAPTVKGHGFGAMLAPFSITTFTGKLSRDVAIA